MRAYGLLRACAVVAAAWILAPPSAARANIEATHEVMFGTRRVELEVSQRTANSTARNAGAPYSDSSIAIEDNSAALSVGVSSMYLAGFANNFLFRQVDNLAQTETEMTRDSVGGAFRWDAGERKSAGISLFLTGNSASEDTTLRNSPLSFYQRVKLDDTETAAGAIFHTAGTVSIGIGGALGTRSLSIRAVDSSANTTTDKISGTSGQSLLVLGIGAPTGLRADAYYIEDQMLKTAGRLYAVDSDSSRSGIRIGAGTGRGISLRYEVTGTKRHIADLQSLDRNIERVGLRFGGGSFSFDVIQQHTDLKTSGTSGGVTNQINTKYDTLFLSMRFDY